MRCDAPYLPAPALHLTVGPARVQELHNRNVLIVEGSGTAAGWVDRAANEPYEVSLCPIVPLQGLNLTLIVEEDHPTMPMCLSNLGFILGHWSVTVHYQSPNVVYPNATALQGGDYMDTFDGACGNTTRFMVPYQVNMELEEEEEEEEAEEIIPDIVGPHLLVRVADDDISHVRIEKTYCAVRESGMNDSYTVVLESEPYFPVTIAVVGDGTQMAIQACPGVDCMQTFGAATTILFTGEADGNDWSVPKTVLLTATDDILGEPVCSEVFLAHLASSDDPKYHELATAGKPIVVIDDDDVGHSGHPAVDALSDASAIHSYVDLLSGTVIEASRMYSNTIFAMDACGGRRKNGGDTFVFEILEESSCPHPCPERVQSSVLPLVDNDDGSYSVNYTLLNVSHLQDVFGHVTVEAGGASSHVHGRPPLLSDPMHDSPTCEVINVAASANGGSASSATQQLSYYAREAVNGILAGSTDGWGYSPTPVSYQSRTEIIFAFRNASYVNKVTILSGVDRQDHMLTGFAIYVTVDEWVRTTATGGTWLPLGDAGMAFGPGVHGGTINGNELTCTGQHEMEIHFNPIRITGMRLEVFDTNGGTSNNLVLTEFMVHSACVRPRGLDTALLIAEIYQNRSSCVEQLSPDGYACLDAVAQGYSCADMYTVYAHYGMDCHCTCRGLALGGSSLTVTAITYLPFEPYPPATIATAVDKPYPNHPYIVGEHSNLNMALAGNDSVVKIDVYDAYGNRLDASNWVYPHPGRGNIRPSAFVANASLLNGTSLLQANLLTNESWSLYGSDLLITAHVLPNGTASETCYDGGWLSSYCVSQPEEGSVRRAVTEVQDGSFLVEYDANRSGYYDFKILLDGLDIGPNGCVTTFDGNPQACTISKGERGMDIVAPGHSSVERERYFSECEAQNAEQNWTACEAWLDPGIQCGADHGVAECASCQATGGSGCPECCDAIAASPEWGCGHGCCAPCPAVQPCRADECTFLGTRDSPFPLRVVPAESDPQSATYSGPGLDGGLVRSAYATFIIQARDRFGNARLQGGDVISVIAVPNTTDYNIGHTKPGHWAPEFIWDENAVVVDLGTGQYRVSWPIATVPDEVWPVASVPYAVKVDLNSESVGACTPLPPHTAHKSDSRPPISALPSWDFVAPHSSGPSHHRGQVTRCTSPRSALLCSAQALTPAPFVQHNGTWSSKWA